MMHEDLLDLASQLAQLEKGKPRQTSLRRAVSSAYYALFHALARLCADKLVGFSKPWDVYVPFYRSLEHGRAKETFKRISSRRGSDVEVIGQTFILLQERRHTADYDPSPFPFGRKETLELIELSRQAMVQLSTLSEGDRLFVATQLVAQRRP
jgi:hypothetical protein